MNSREWQALLEEWSAQAVKRAAAEVRPGPLSGLGAPGATEAELAAAEARLGRALPPSYRSFLACTNGLRQPMDFTPARGGHLWPADRIEWFRVRNADLIAAYSNVKLAIPDQLYFVYGPEQDPAYLRTEYLPELLEISHDGDGFYLLNPQVVGPDGEWEAWFFASWHPGAQRHRSFAELMRAHWQSFRENDLQGF